MKAPDCSRQKAHNYCFRQVLVIGIILEAIISGVSGGFKAISILKLFILWPSMKFDEFLPNLMTDKIKANGFKIDTVRVPL